jgi:hypothetical protein
MIDRRKFDVSAEAFLMRIIKMTSEPALMFCASPTESSGTMPSYRIDYSIASKSSPIAIGTGVSIPRDSVVYTCVAIGQTNHATESWPNGTNVVIECVGIPGFPGATLPRISGIIRFRSQDAQKDPLHFIHGDVLRPVGVGPKVVCQLVNDQARKWGGGVARSAAHKYPQAQHQFSEWMLQTTKRDRLGRVHFADIGNDTFIASLVAQEGYGPSALPRIRYASLERCLSEVTKFALNHKASVHLPRLGMGQSGGTWDTIEQIVRETLVINGIHVTVYDLPPKRQAAGSGLLL